MQPINRRDFMTASGLAAGAVLDPTQILQSESGSVSAAEPAEFVVPRGQRQLFLDDYGVAETQNLARTMHPGAKKGAVIRPDPSRGVTTLQVRSAPNWDPEANHFKFWVMSQPDDLRKGLG